MQKRNVSIALRELLDRDRISPTELHRRTGVPQSTLSRILSGKIVDPSDKHISRIAEYFRVSTDYVRGRAPVGALRDDGRDPDRQRHGEKHRQARWRTAGDRLVMDMTPLEECANVATQPQGHAVHR